MGRRILTIGFLGLIFGVPLAQVGVDLSRRQRVQYTGLFSRPPTPANLRQYERVMEEQSWAVRTARPALGKLMFTALNDAGSNVVAGREGWLFFRPGITYLVEPDLGHQDAVMAAITRFGKQLNSRGIVLLVVPVPEKASVYPDLLTRRCASFLHYRSPTEDLLEKLDRRGVMTVNLFAVFRKARLRLTSAGRHSALTTAARQGQPRLYLREDSHWTPAGMKLAAEAVASKLRESGLATRRREYAASQVTIGRHGDLAEMAGIGSQVETVECQQIKDSSGLLIPRIDRDGIYSNDHLADTPMESAVLLLGDSFCRIYQTPESRSLGEPRQSETGKCLLPGSAGLPSCLAYTLGMSIDYIISDGGAATEVRQTLAVNTFMLQQKKVVIWIFAERDVALGKAGWLDVPLP